MPFGRRGRNLYRNLAHQALAAIRAQQGLDRDLVAGTRFGDIGARRFQPRRTAIGNQVEVQLHAFNLRRVIRILEDAAEVLADGHRNVVGRGRVAVERREHVLHAELGIAQHRDVSRQPVGRVLAVLVHALQRVEHRGHHRRGRDLGVVQHLVVKLLGMR